MAFVDEINIELKAGKGGDGLGVFRKEYQQRYGKAAGGDGGRGGSVFVEAIKDLGYLINYSGQTVIEAEDGEMGKKMRKEGRNGEDLVIKVPRGSLVTNVTTGQVYDLTQVGQRVCVLRGGAAGLGNFNFVSPTNRSPEDGTPGKEGQIGTFKIELHLIADAGFVGFPNVGKSTLLNTLTNAKSQVADYHFTTLEPHLGAFEGFILADIPGIISGASQGKGLGYKFLKHISRTKTLIHCISAESEDPHSDYLAIRAELESYDAQLAQKDEFVLLTKTDELEKEDIKVVVKNLSSKIKKPVLPVSILDEESVKAFSEMLLHYFNEQLKNLKEVEPAEVTT